MKKRLFIPVISLVLIIALSFAVSPVMATRDIKVASNTKTSQKIGVKNAKFLNMLNHNFVYGESFASLEQIINCSVVSVVKNNGCDNEFVSENQVYDFAYDMYGVEIDDFTCVNVSFPKKSGYVYVIPKGYETYNHKFVSATVCEDGTISVITDVEILTHDGETETCKAVSRFIENENSAFGYNLLSSVLVSNVVNA